MSSRSKYHWLSEDVVLAIHEAQVAEHGGAAGLRDAGLLDSALARPRSAAAYGKADVPDLAALYAIGVIRNHPFLDGNKRVGAVLLETFLALHGYELEATDAELLLRIMTLADGTRSERQFTAWVNKCARRHRRKRST